MDLETWGKVSLGAETTPCLSKLISHDCITQGVKGDGGSESLSICCGKTLRGRRKGSTDFGIPHRSPQWPMHGKSLNQANLVKIPWDIFNSF